MIHDLLIIFAIPSVVFYRWMKGWLIYLRMHVHLFIFKSLVKFCNLISYIRTMKHIYWLGKVRGLIQINQSFLRFAGDKNKDNDYIRLSSPSWELQIVFLTLWINTICKSCLKLPFQLPKPISFTINSFDLTKM